MPTAEAFPPEAIRTVQAHAPTVARRFAEEGDDLAHRVIEKFADHRRVCVRASCRTCRGQAERRFVIRALKNEALDILNERKLRLERESRGARSETLDDADPAVAIEEHETEELLKYTASELAALRDRDRGWYEAFLLSSTGRSHREIAAILSLSEANSQQSVSRARRFLHGLRRKRLLAMAAVGLAAVAVATLVYRATRPAAELASTPLGAISLPSTALPAEEFAPVGSWTAQDLVSTPLAGG